VRLVRVLYALYIGGNGFLYPFWGLFLRRHGLSGTQIGFISMVMSGAVLLAAVGWGRLSDRTTAPKRILQFALFLSAVVTIILRFQDSFWPLLIVAGFYGASVAGIQPMLYTLGYDLTERMPSIGFGSVRVWGSIGWVVFVLLGGWAIQRANLGFGFYGQTGAFLLAIAVIFFLQFSPSRYEVAETSGGIQKDLLKNRDLLILTAAVAVGYLARVGPLRFESIYLDELGAGEMLIGVVNMAGAVLEIGAMFWADRLVAKRSFLTILKVNWVIEIVIMAAILIHPSIPVFIVVRAIGGISFSLYSVALVGVIGRLVGGDSLGAWMAMLTVTVPSLMEIVGSPLSGVAFDAFGAYWLYAIALGCDALALLLIQGVRTRSRRTMAAA